MSHMAKNTSHAIRQLYSAKRIELYLHGLAPSDPNLSLETSALAGHEKIPIVLMSNMDRRAYTKLSQALVVLLRSLNLLARSRKVGSCSLL